MNERACYEQLRQLRWPDGVTCPRCHSPKVTVHARCVRTTRAKYRCRACSRMFTDLTGTAFARTKLPLTTWLLYLRVISRGSSTSELSKELGVKWDTVASVQRRVALAMRRSELVQQLRAIALRDAGQG